MAYEGIICGVRAAERCNLFERLASTMATAIVGARATPAALTGVPREALTGTCGGVTGATARAFHLNCVLVIISGGAIPAPAMRACSLRAVSALVCVHRLCLLFPSEASARVLLGQFYVVAIFAVGS
mmetsp:Transcript_20976/g.37151  ORF Transcript_20976/g.37151 Transcript_20976/m.37151 type:complete len:127 (+) Transcript_20976:267-647(+)